MLLSEILDVKKFGVSDCEIESISKIAENTKCNDVFFCLTDDKNLAEKRCEVAKKMGAKLVLSQFDFDGCVCCKDIRKEFALACKKFYQNACDDLKIVGITGTNGKTTTSHVVSQILERNGKKVGIIGTNGIFYCGKKFDYEMTTPDADILHKTFLDMKNSGVEYVVMEVSAHSIAQSRVEGIDFEIGVLTNITQDHLDYFGTFENYEKTKLDFISKKHIKKAVVCVDDLCARKAIEKSDVPVITYGIENPSDCFALDIVCDINGSSFVGNICDEVVEIKTNLIGKYNVLNSLASLAVCQSLGLEKDMLARGLNFINPVEGRFNVVNLSGCYVVIDYAHTPDGLLNVLKTARELTDKKVYVMFGCGGDRDKGKRPIMGAIAEKFADYVCLTSDNPRNEEPESIVKDIERGMKKPHFVEISRKLATNKMLNFMQKGDILIIAGKGAEKYQEINGNKYPYNDFDTVYQYYKDSLPFKSKGRECYDC